MLSVTTTTEKKFNMSSGSEVTVSSPLLVVNESVEVLSYKHCRASTRSLHFPRWAGLIYNDEGKKGETGVIKQGRPVVVESRGCERNGMENGSHAPPQDFKGKVEFLEGFRGTILTTLTSRVYLNTSYSDVIRKVGVGFRLLQQLDL